MKTSEREHERNKAHKWINSIGIENATYLEVHDNGDFTVYLPDYTAMDAAWSKLHMAQATVKRTSFKGKQYQYVRFGMPETTDAIREDGAGSASTRVENGDE